MIVKDEFLERRRVEFAIGAEFKRHLCHPVGFTRGVESKSVCFTFGDTHHGVEKRRGEKEQRAENQRQQREPRWIGNIAHAPRVAPASDGCIKQYSGKSESNENKNAQIGQQFCTVIKNVMAHL